MVQFYKFDHIIEDEKLITDILLKDAAEELLTDVSDLEIHEVYFDDVDQNIFYNIYTKQLSQSIDCEMFYWEFQLLLEKHQNNTSPWLNKYYKYLSHGSSNITKN